MDNNAFRTLVNQQLKKSTKEIAREAVETEFRQKAQKRGGGRRGRRSEYDSDSASEDDDDDDNLTKRRRDDDDDTNNEVNNNNHKNEPEWKRRRKEKAAATSTTYRDRAKERREGKNLDYNDTTVATTYNNGDEYTDKKRQAELSKFLGGDEQHTHLVKGLDMALAQKVRREEMGTDGREQEEEDLDQLLEDAYNNTQQQQETTDSASTKSKKSSSIAMIQPKTELGKSVQTYLLKHHHRQQQQQQQHSNNNSTTTTTSSSLAAATKLPQSIQINSTKQNSIQRSHYTFSLDSTIQKRSHAWDIPQLKMIGGVVGSGQQRQQQASMTPLDCHLIATIRNKLDGALNSGSGYKSKRVNDDDGDGGMERIIIDHDGNVTKKHQLQQQHLSSLDKEGDIKEQSSDGNIIDHNTRESSSPTSNKKNDDSDDDDSDDDIFANVGAYVPPTAVAAPEDNAVPATTATTGGVTTTVQTNKDDAATFSTTTTPTKKKSSIFDNLITNESRNDINNSQKRQSMRLPHTQQQQQQQSTQFNDGKKHVIDRDVFGGNRKKHEEQRHSQAMKRRGPQTAAMEGVSMTNYQGGYGEEMDTDFLNEDEDEYRKLKRRDDNDDDGGSKGGNVDADDDDDED